MENPIKIDDLGVPLFMETSKNPSVPTKQKHHTGPYEVAAVKKIDGVPPPRFNLVFQVSALFHHEWPRFPILE